MRRGGDTFTLDTSLSLILRRGSRHRRIFDSTSGPIYPGIQLGGGMWEGEGNTLTLALSRQGRGDWTPSATSRDWRRLDGWVLFVEGVGLLVGVGGV